MNELPTFIEPFAGSNNIILMVKDLGFENPWVAFDIEPPTETMVDDVPVIQRDTILDYPKGYKVAITNPPYLAKNSATQRKMLYNGHPYDDLYQKALHIMLENNEYVAAIIPETFIKQKLFHNRLLSIISLTCRMFDDTEHPVCLALFVPEKEKNSNNFSVWQNNSYIGEYKKLEEHVLSPTEKFPWVFNDPNGLIGLKAADGNKRADIAFILGEEIMSTSIKVSSRHNTRISLKGVDLTKDEIDNLIQLANIILKERRNTTKDVFMTAHRGLREDGKYRRRLDFSQARDILNLAYSKIKK